MNFRMRIAAWFGISLTLLIGLMMATAHWHLDEELRMDRVDRTHPKNADWVLHESFTNEEVHDILSELMKIWLWTGVPAICISLGIGVLLARHSVRPIRLINRQLAEVTPESMRGGIILPVNDPVLADLVDHINLSLRRGGIAYREMAEFSSKVAHELRTPLTLLRMKIEQSTDMPPDVQEELQEELARLSRFVERALIAAKAESGTLEVCANELDLSGLLGDLGEDYHLLAAEKGLGFISRISPAIHVITDSDLLRQLLHNLLGNALRYARSEIEVKLQADGEIPVITIANDCDFATMAAAGLGFGLRLAEAVCRATDIDLQIERSPGRFVVTLRIRTLSK